MPTAPVIPRFLTSTTAVEDQLYAELQSAIDGGRRVIAVSAAPSSDASVRGEFLRWFLLEAMPAGKPLIVRFELKNANISSEFNLEGAQLETLLLFESCEFKSNIELSDATIFGFELAGGSARQVTADRLVTKSSLRLRPPKQQKLGPSIERLRICGAEICGNLDLRGCVLGATGSQHDLPSLFADGLTVKGNALLSEGFTARGEVRLNGSMFERNL
jgi:hypothetical protein